MKFYVLEPDDMLFGRKWAYGEDVDPLKLGPSQKCPQCGRAVTSKEWLPPHYVKISSANPEKWGDFLWGTYFPFMVSERFREACEQEGLRGIEGFYPPAEIVRVGRRKTGDVPAEMPTYQLVKLPWGRGEMDDEASQVERKGNGCAYCKGNPIRYERIVLRVWEGDDLFIPRGLFGVVMASERMKSVIERYELKNVWVIPSECYGYDEHRRGLWYMHETCS